MQHQKLYQDQVLECLNALNLLAVASYDGAMCNNYTNIIAIMQNK